MTNSIVVPSPSRPGLPPVVQEFVEKCPGAVLYQSPGRINLIGEHTDYNEGFVLPGAANLHLTFAVIPHADPAFHVHAGRYDERVVIGLEGPPIPMGHWSRYVAAVVQTANAHGLPLLGLDMVFDGDLPPGGGMSSSSALTCGLIFIMDHQFGWHLPKERLIHLAQESEHRTGVKGGIMDQFAIISSRRNEALLLDCRHLTTTRVAMPEEGPSWYVLDSGVHHSLVDSPYNQRREACERIVKLAAHLRPGISALRDLDIPDLEQLAGQADPSDLAKASFVLAENRRVWAMVEALARRDWTMAGKLLLQSHHGLRYFYQVSCEELDFLVDTLITLPGVYGARLMGAGFGGNVLLLADADQMNTIQDCMTSDYHLRFGLPLNLHPIMLDDGIHIIESH